MKKYFLFLYLFLIVGSGCTELHPYRSVSINLTPLHLAAENGNIELIKTLLSKGSKVDSRAKVTEATPLHLAAWKGQHEAAELLIKSGADVNARTDFGATPLQYASGLNSSKCLVPPGQDSPGLSDSHLSVVDLLIKNGADVNIRDESGGTALMRTAACNAHQIAFLLIKHGAGMDVREHQYTALEISIYRGPEVAKLLIKHGARVNSQDKYTGDTPLHMAVKVKRHDLIELLLLHGADTSVINNSGWTPLDVSAESSIDEIFIRHMKAKHSE